jgi:hypothetical protein
MECPAELYAVYVSGPDIDRLAEGEKLETNLLHRCLSGPLGRRETEFELQRARIVALTKESEAEECSISCFDLWAMEKQG